MPVTVRRGAKAQPAMIVVKFEKVGDVIAQAKGCNITKKEVTRSIRASLPASGLQDLPAS